MGIFGAAKKGFGMLGKIRAKRRMLTGKSTRSERLKFGERSRDIKSVPVSPRVKKEGVAASVARTKSDAYLKNIDEVNKHTRAITEAGEAKKKLQHMVDTKRAYKIGKKSIHPRDPGKKRQIGE